MNLIKKQFSNRSINEPRDDHARIYERTDEGRLIETNNGTEQSCHNQQHREETNKVADHTYKAVLTARTPPNRSQLPFQSRSHCEEGKGRRVERNETIDYPNITKDLVFVNSSYNKTRKIIFEENSHHCENTYKRYENRIQESSKSARVIRQREDKYRMLRQTVEDPGRGTSYVFTRRREK